MGTVGYMAPEQLRGQIVDSRCDLFSFGCVLYEILAGVAPFRRESPAETIAAILNEQPRPLTHIAPDVPQDICALVDLCLMKVPAQRIASARAISSTLQAVLTNPTSEPLPATTDILPKQVAMASGHEATSTIMSRATRDDMRQPSSPSIAIAPRSRQSTLGTRIVTGCAISMGVAMVVAIAFAVVLMVNNFPKFRSWFTGEFARPYQWEEVARFWRPPPADAGSQLLFGKRVGRYELIEHDDQAHVPELRIELPGYRAVYRAGSSQEINLFVYRATRLEKEAVYRRAYDVLAPEDEDAPRSFFITGSVEGSFLAYQVNSRKDLMPYGIFWWDQNWLFFARSRNVENLEVFLKEYLAVLSGAESVEDLDSLE
jgi:hypothetical protein